LKSVAVVSVIAAYWLSLWVQESTVRITAWTNVRGLISSRSEVPYPPTSLKAGRHGVAVADVLISPDGVVRTIEVLEAPDPEIAAAVTAGLKGWKFKTVSNPATGTPAAIRSKIILYFHIENGRGQVLTPDEMVARRGKPAAVPATAQGPPPTTFPSVTEDQYKRLVAQGSPRPILVDIRDRPAFRSRAYPGAINLPEREMGSRAAAELPRGTQIVLDCPKTVAGLCDHAARSLWRQGFTKLLLLERE
jgi:rhodanese-related sulfurtransferase